LYTARSSGVDDKVHSGFNYGHDYRADKLSVLRVAVVRSQSAIAKRATLSAAEQSTA